MLEQLISFLIKKGYIQDKPSRIVRVCPGTTSVNYIIKNGQKKLVYKVMFNEERLQNILINFKLVERGNYAPKLLSGRISYPQKNGVLMEYKSGKILKPSYLKKPICRSLTKVYSQFLSDINAKKPPKSIIPENDLLDLKKKALKQLNQKQHFGMRPFARYLKNWLKSIPDSQLRRQTNKTKVIHGDLKPRNILIDKDNHLTILDLEGLMFGYPSEDWARFIMRSIERLMDPWRVYKFTKKQAQVLIQNLPYSKKEWLLGYYNFLIQKLEKKSRKPLTLYQALNLCVIIHYATKLMPKKTA